MRVVAVSGSKALNGRSFPFRALVAFCITVSLAFGPGARCEETLAAPWFVELLAKATSGDANAQYDIGMIYDIGREVSRDTDTAARWYRMAAERGHAPAQFKLGLQCARGEGVPLSPKEAAKWYRLAAEQGLAEAQYNLGLLCARGEGVPLSPEEAAKWYRMAAEQGVPDAQLNLGVACEKGEGVPLSPEEAAKWYRMAAEQGLAEAQYNLGLLCARGEGVPLSREEAASWYRMAAEQGLAAAQCRLGLVFASGEGVPQDYVVAAKWLRMAAEQGFPRAQASLGLFYSAGKGVPQSLSESARLYLLAAEQGDEFSQFELALAYHNGQGVLQDPVEAHAWMCLAAMSGDKKAVEARDSHDALVGMEVVQAGRVRAKELLSRIQSQQSLGERSGDPPDAGRTVASPAQASGSGVVITADGHILTAAHVISGAKRLIVRTFQGERQGRVLRVDEANDLAVLKVDGLTLDPLPIGSSRRIRLGQAIATLGFPNISIQGYSPKLTRGEISSASGAGDDPRTWQISAPVQTGNSGGPLLDERGRLIGIVQAKLGIAAAEATRDLPQNVGYALKIDYALPLIDQYLGDTYRVEEGGAATVPFEDMVAMASRTAVLILVY